jgi:glycosyltransferase involved in cell wall biosynthesis
MKKILIVIPNRVNEVNFTAFSLRKQTLQNFRIVSATDTEKRGANYVRNEGFENEWRGEEFVLFSDNDINWMPDALERMLAKLQATPDSSYCYGGYLLDGHTFCMQEWDAEQLKKGNYISTMSLIRADDFPGFDEDIKRLQDWDLWLTMLEKGKKGVYCGGLVFETYVRNGISAGVDISYEEALEVVIRKHSELILNLK